MTTKQDHLIGFSPRQIKCIMTIAQGVNYRQTCLLHGVARCTLWQWRKDKRFQEAIEIQRSMFVNKMTNDAFDLRLDANKLLTEQLQSNTREAVEIAFRVLVSLGIGSTNLSKLKQTLNS